MSQLTPTPEAPAESAGIPKPSYAPAAMALGVTFLAWGTQTQYLMSVAGAGLIGCALWMWMREIADQWREAE